MTNTNYMFNRCSSLTNIDLSNFNTNNIIDIRGMFRGCLSLKNINISNFNTNNTTNMRFMFYNCEKLIKNKVITIDKRILNLFDI